MKIRPYALQENELNTAVDEITAGYSGDKAWAKHYVHRTSWRVLGDYAFIRKNLNDCESILDIGGTPPLLAHLIKQESRASIEVCDLHAEAFASYLTKWNIAFSSSRSLASGSLLTKKRHYDTVVCSEVIEHVPGNLLSAVDAIADKVRINGNLLLTTPNLCSIAGAAAIFLNGSGLASKPSELARHQFLKAGEPPFYYGHIREFTYKEVVDLFENAGFELIKFASQPIPWRAEYGWQRKCQKICEEVLPRMARTAKYWFKKTRDQRYTRISQD